eukprot:scaffold17736_cov57-Attheya_sp.AAC.2
MLMKKIQTWQTLAAKTLAPMGDRILIRRAVKETQTAGGIYLPTGDAAKSPNEGEVVSTGPGIRDISGVLHAPTLTKGDAVLLPEYGGMKIECSVESKKQYRDYEYLVGGSKFRDCPEK